MRDWKGEKEITSFNNLLLAIKANQYKTIRIPATCRDEKVRAAGVVRVIKFMLGLRSLCGNPTDVCLRDSYFCECAYLGYILHKFIAYLYDKNDHIVCVNVNVRIENV